MDNTETPGQAPATSPHNLWVRALWMLILALFCQVAGTLLGLLALLQLALALLTGKPNERLCGLARSLGRYLGQIAQFVGFASEQLPFPFSDWPGNTP